MALTPVTTRGRLVAGPCVVKMGGMQIAPLRRYNHPDISDHVVHFTGRSGADGPGVPDEIANLKDWERLAQILVDERILAFPPFGSDDPVVCFTECTRAGIQTLMAESRYSPCGIAFTKDFLFRKGGGPALYIRGDEWGSVAGMPAELRARAVRLWPGATSTHGLPLPWYVTRPSEWLHEREWRIVGDGSPAGLRFTWADVAFVIAPHPRWADFVAGFIGLFAPEYEPHFRSLPVVVVSSDGTVIDDPARAWL